MASIKTGPLGQTYAKFLSSPTEDVLHDNAALHYITALKSVSKNNIISHLRREAALYEKKDETILSCVESGNSCVLEIATTIKFVNGGGSYLSGIDDNFVSDQTVIAPVLHFVNFENNHIKDIRLHWDQATFLKQINVIGKTGRNWPIQLGKDQIKLIKDSQSNFSEEMVKNSTPDSSRPGSSRSGRDSLSLFEPKDVDIESPKQAVVPPRAAARPPTRDLKDIVEGGEPEAPRTPKAGMDRASRRTFQLGQEIAAEDSLQDRKIKGDPTKYKHFEFSDLTDLNAALPETKPPKRTSVYNKGKSWDFEDFVTPEKVPRRFRPQDERTYDWSDEERPKSPVFREIKHAPRPDAESHFQLTDQSPEKQDPAPSKPYIRKETVSHFEFTDKSPNDGINIAGDGMGGRKGTYKHNIFDPEAPIINNRVALDRAANKDGINTAGDGMGGKKGSTRHNIFEDYSAQDDSPSDRGKNSKILAERSMEAKNTTSNWGFSPRATPESGNQGININGDGMGGKKGAYKHNIFDVDSPIRPPTNVKIDRNQEVHWGNTPSKSENMPIRNSSKGINIGGDGMGGRKGAYKHDIFGMN